MNPAWVAGYVRAVGLLNRRLGATAAHEVAASGSLAAAQRLLSKSAYGHRIRLGASLIDTEQAVAAEALWHLRVLAGWQPRAGAVTIRLLAGGFDVANIRALAAAPTGGPTPPPYELGALATAWPRVRDATTAPQLRAALRQTAWGDPGGESVSDITFGVTVGWAARVIAGVPEATRWAAGGVALMTARQLLLRAQPLTDTTAHRVRRILGPAALAANDIGKFRAALPVSARWALSDVETVDELWRAEFRWWSRIEQDGRDLLRQRRFGPATVVGVTALLITDAWRTRAALQSAAAEDISGEVFDGLLR